MSEHPTAGELILAHRKAAMALQSALISNGRRGASDEAISQINHAGEAMAKTERDLLAFWAANKEVSDDHD